MAKTLPYYEMMDSNPLKIEYHKKHKNKKKRKPAPRTNAPSRSVAKKSDTYSKNRKPNFGNALAKAALKKFTGLDVEDWGHS